MLFAASFLTSLNPIVPLDPMQLLAASWLAYVMVSVGAAGIGTALWLTLLSIESIATNEKDSRVDRFVEAPFFSLRSWFRYGKRVGLPLFTFAMVTQIVSTLAAIDALAAGWMTAVFALGIGLAGVILLLVSKGFKSAYIVLARKVRGEENELVEMSHSNS